MENVKTISTPLEDKHWNECRQIAHYQDENKKLKELLRQAMKDLDRQGCENFCSTCMYGGKFNLPFCNRDKFKWHHTTEAEEILKGAETE